MVKLTGTGVGSANVQPHQPDLPEHCRGINFFCDGHRDEQAGQSAISLSPAASADYSVTGGTCGAHSPRRSSCTITVTFAPQYKGSIKGALAITTNGAFSPQIVGLTGTATGGPTLPLTISPASLTFTSTGVGATSRRQGGYRYKQEHRHDHDQIPSPLSANFAAVGSGTTPCGGALAKSAKCTLSVTFTPTDTGSIKGAVAIATSGGTVSPQIIGLSGTGAIPVTAVAD